MFLRAKTLPGLCIAPKKKHCEEFYCWLTCCMAFVNVKECGLDGWACQYITMNTSIVCKKRTYGKSLNFGWLGPYFQVFRITILKFANVDIYQWRELNLSPLETPIKVASGCSILHIIDNKLSLWIQARLRLDSSLMSTFRFGHYWKVIFHHAASFSYLSPFGRNPLNGAPTLIKRPI